MPFPRVLPGVAPQPESASPATFAQYLQEEELRAAAERSSLDQGYDEGPAPAKPEPPAPITDPGSMPPEVFRELRKRYQASARGSAERKSGVFEETKDGQTYRYDAYARQEAMGFPRDRAHGTAVNFLERLGQEFGGGERARLLNIQGRQQEAANRLKERELAGEEAYKNAALEGARADRRDRRTVAETEIAGRAYDRAMTRYVASQPKPMNAQEEATADMHKALAEVYREQAKALQQGRTKNGAAPKAPYTVDQAWTNLRDAHSEIAAIQEEIRQIDASAPRGTRFLPDFAEAALGVGAYNDQKDVELKDDKGRTYATVPASQVQSHRTDLQKELDFYNEQARKFREFIKNDGRVRADEMPHTATEDQGPPASEPDRGVATAKPTAGTTPLTMAGDRRPIPPPEVLRNLPYRDQVYYQLAQEYPAMSHHDLMIMARQVVAGQKPEPPKMGERPLDIR